MALAVVFAAIVVWYQRGTVQLPDGRQVTVLSVTYGTNHTWVEGPLWAKAIRTFVSRRKALQYGLRIYEKKSAQPSLTVLTHWRLPSTNQAPHYASLRDRHGVESEPQYAAIDGPVGKTGTAIMAWDFANFPRTQQKFQIRFYEREQGRLRLLGETSVPNVPNVAQVDAVTTGAPPPVTVKKDGIEFTLTMLRSGGEVATNLIRSDVQVATWTEARFTVLDQGQRATNWTVERLLANSESGNRLHPLPRATLSIDGDYRVAFPDAVWPDEPAWTISGEFARNSGFIETNRWTLGPIPAIRNTSAFTTNIWHQLNGVRIDQLGLRPASGFIPYVRGGFRRTTDLAVEFTPTSDRSHLALVGVTDNLDRPLRFSRGGEPVEHRYVAGLEVPTNSTTLNLTFVVHESYEVKFLVKPVWVPTGAVSR